MGVSRLLAALTGAAVAIFAGAASARPACPVVDSFKGFVDLSARTAEMPPEKQAQAFRSDYLSRHGALYTPEVISLPSGPALDARALKAMKRVREHPEWRAFDLELQRSFRRVAERLAGEFPDFRCDFLVYATETFGVMDGAGRVVSGRPSLIFGIDTIAQSWTPQALPVFLSHELFHRYHFQAAGFSDDLGERDLIWRSLWAEGLATYVSARLNPSNPLSDALIVPKDLETRAKPFVPQMATELLAAADKVDAKTFGKFFMGGDAEARRAGWPSRSGYY
ncbi:MAG TPA: hypothetical protein VHY34_08590, partial [Caulobacteraceae bacterium]|nr:hypothetical protein [Caulobacteraceae bacterium]